MPDTPSSEDPLKDDYQAALRELQPGDAGEIELGSLPPEVLKAGMEAAAGDLGYELRWGTPVAPNMLRFQVVRPETPRPNGKATSGGSPPSDGDIARIRQQIETWRERLIDLTQRNPLLGLNRSRVSKLRVVEPNVGTLYDTLVVRGDPLRLPIARRRVAPAENVQPALPAEEPVADGGADEAEAATVRGAWEVLRGDVTFAEAPQDLGRRLRRIRDNARTTLEERGVTTLHLTLGVVSWNDPQYGPSEAPLYLVPCAIEVTAPDQPPLLAASDEDPQLNPALALYLRQRYQRTLPDVPEEPTAGELARLLAHTRGILGGEFKVDEVAWLSTFSFETLAMYRDLGLLAEAATDHEVVRALSGLSAAVDTEASERLGDDLDTKEPGREVPIPVLPADSSQLRALALARAGRHLLVHGPPGTGKSQTIANLIADALGQGQTVLFVSAKMAALQVVHDRLVERGFDRFCLEAHSTKSGKARIVDELKRALEAAGYANGGDPSAEINRYARVRESLNEAVRELHAQRTPLNASVYEGLGHFAQLEAAPEVKGPLPWADIRQVEREALETALDILADLQAEHATFLVRASHPWRGCQVREAGVATTDRLMQALGTVRRACATAFELETELEPFLGPLRGRSPVELKRADEAVGILVETDWLPDGWSSAATSELDKRAEALRAAVEEVDALAQLRAKFGEQVERKVDPLDVCELLGHAGTAFAHWYNRLWPSPYSRWLRSVREQVHPREDSHEALVALAETAESIRQATQALEARRRDVSDLLPPMATWPERADLENASLAYARAAAMRRGQLRFGGVPPPDEEPRTLATSTRAAAQRLLNEVVSSRDLDEALQTLNEAWRGHFVQQSAPAEVPLGSLAARCSEALAEPRRLGEWVLLQHILDRAGEVGLIRFLEALPGEVGDRAQAIFRRRFWQLWTDSHIASVQALGLFSGRKREELIREFKQLDERLRETMRRKNQDGAAQRAGRISETAQYARDSQLGILRRDLQRKRPRPLRRLFADVPLVLQAIKPCMLMSPVSVSTYLTPGSLSFDLVVFDEASQLPPQEAIPSILRAKQVVVAGDDKQLPPSSFFSSSLFSEEQQDKDEAVEDSAPLESLLRECAAAVPFFSENRLTWHYRSRDERLIAFSNHQFYDGGLVTFPEPSEPEDRGVQLRFVADGVYDRGKSRQNRREARATVAELFKQVDEHPSRSVGVVALSTSHKEAIEDALEEGLRERPDLRDRLFDTEAAEPFFIKALENVQGDERDTIIISTGYGPDASGTLHLNFGPLNMEGGWRRLNVLVTRAKYLVLLVTSLRSQQLGAVGPGNRGAGALRDYLAYAERGGKLAVEPPQLTDAETNDFEDAIAGALRGRGLQVDEQVGASSFRIDLAVRDPREPSRYVLGIECDGATYHSSRAARDRDLLRSEMLRSMGWRLHRIWSLDWFRDPEATVNAAVSAVERAMALSEPPDEVSAPSPTPDVPPVITASEPPSPLPLLYPAGVVYERAILHSRSDRDVLLYQWATVPLGEDLAQVVAAEGPIHPDELLDRLKEHHRVQRAGDNIRRNLLRAIRYATAQHRISQDADGFLRPAGQTGAERFRLPNDSAAARSIERIPTAELRLAVLHVVESQFALPRDALVRATAQVLGYARTSQDIAERIGEVVDDLIDSGELRRNGPDQISLS